MGFFDVSFAFVCLIILASIPSFLAQNTQQDYLAAHNAARAQVGVGPMHWDKVVAAYAINYASKIQKENTCNNLVHSGGPYGENRAAAIPDLTGQQAVNLWVEEKSYYNYQSNSCADGRVCGHYTQVVWQNSVGLGCARVRCNNGWWYIICNYDPPGNYVGQRPYVLNSSSWMRASPEPAPSASLAPGPSLAPSPLLALGPSLAPVPSVAPGPSRSKKPKKWKVGLSVGVVATFLSALALLFFCCKLRRRNGCLGGVRILMNILDRSAETPNHGYKGDDESLFFSFTSIQIATNHFSDENKLGQGGFGLVYKGKLVNGVEIAVKRLNRMSGHGIEQFKNEVAVISKLQHRNLVRLLGYCIHGDERLLIYEYLQNKSLDSILFDVAKRGTLDWKRRLIIIEGIAQGLLYLHKYSRLRIIHRDLKTSNVLLDKDLKPKISDFGTARIFGDNEIRANTRTIVGTYGYMSPEYAMDGIFSEKSDVFSFGVMILEITSGKKNTSFYDSDRHLNLIGHVWDLWTEGRISEIVDSSLDETISKREVQQYVQVGLLCVQENAADRPLMSDVVPMLLKESMILASPKRPAFSEIMSLIDTNRPENPEYCTVNTVTISDLDGR